MLETKEQALQDKSENTRPKIATTRGRAAALLANLNSSSDSDDSNDNKEVSLKSKKPYKNKGIYADIMKITKKELANTKSKVKVVDENIMDCKNKNKSETEESESKLSESNNQNTSENSDDGTDTSSVDSHPNRKKTKISRNELVNSSPSPPPPPLPTTNNVRKTRKSLTNIDKQLKELEKLKDLTSKKILKPDSADFAGNDLSNLDEDETITVRVSTKTGIQRWEIKKSEQFLIIFQNLSQTENTRIENLRLMLKDKKISYTDTAASLNLQPYNIIDCEKIKGKIQERIKIVDNEDESESTPLMIYITLQSQEGRKSRVKFLIAKDEPFKNMLNIYCEKFGLPSNNYIMEFDGDIVEPMDTANGLILDGDEIFDVKKTNKPTMQLLKENKINYEYDDEVLIV